MVCSRSIRVPNRMLVEIRGHAGRMQGFVTPLHGGKDLVPIALDIGAVGVQMGLESRLGENALAQGDLFRNRHSDTQWDDAKIRDDFHASIVTGRRARVRVKFGT